MIDWNKKTALVGLMCFASFGFGVFFDITWKYPTVYTLQPEERDAATGTSLIQLNMSTPFQSTENKDQTVMSLAPPSSTLPIARTDTWVLLLSYQRTGSSFIGGLFNDPERVFYIYEPMDPLYAAIFGVENGWTVPSDILSNKDGTLRQIPQDELYATYWLMEKIYTCQMSSLPPAILAHKFWKVFASTMTHSASYVKCLNAKGIKPESALTNCQRHIRAKCKMRFGQDEKSQSECKHYLWGDNLKYPMDYLPNSVKNRKTIVDENLPDNFIKYYQCLAALDESLRTCAAENFDKPCSEKPLHAIKTVRGNMRIADHLMKNHDNFYLLHTFRDPRGAVSSRIRADWSQGYYSTRGKVVNEAHLYCSQVLDDVHRSTNLSNLGYQSRIKQVVYDGFSQEPLLNTLDIYHALNIEPSMKIKDIFASNRKLPSTKKSESIAQKWTKTLSSTNLQAIKTECDSFFKEINFPWS